MNSYPQLKIFCVDHIFHHIEFERLNQPVSLTELLLLRQQLAHHLQIIGKDLLQPCIGGDLAFNVARHPSKKYAQLANLATHSPSLPGKAITTGSIQASWTQTRITLTQPHTVLMTPPYQPLPGTIQQLAVGRKTHHLSLNRGVHRLLL